MTADVVGVATFPVAFTVLDSASIAIGLVCAMVIAVDVRRRPQPMRIMSVVGPVTVLFGGIPWSLFNDRWARGRRRRLPDC